MKRKMNVIFANRTWGCGSPTLSWRWRTSAGSFKWIIRKHKMFWLIKMSFAVFVWHCLKQATSILCMPVWFNWVTRSQTNIWHLHLQQKTGPWFSQALTDRTNHRDMAAAQTSCDCRRAIRASGEDAIRSWLSSIIPPPCRRKAHSSCRGHVLRGERWQLLSSVIITHSQTSWNKDATKDPVEMGPAVPRAHTHMKEPWNITLKYARYHTSTLSLACPADLHWGNESKRGTETRKWWILRDFWRKLELCMLV